MKSILVTGATGTLGREVQRILVEKKKDVRLLSRSAHVDDEPSHWLVGDLKKNVGLDAAVESVDTIIHCATGAGDTLAAENLIAAATRTGVAHLVYISIVGVDRIPFGYYRTKFQVERLIEESGLPHTILRATQFHNLVYSIFSAQHYWPVLFIPDIRVQSIEVAEVAERLVEVALDPPAGRVPDIGGPQVRTIRELAELYLASSGSRRRVVGLPLRGRAITAFRVGDHLCPDNPYGTGTFEQFIARTGASGSTG